MWAGFILAGGMDLINGLHFPVFPSSPGSVANSLTCALFFTTKPWNAIGWTPGVIFPFAIGMGYFYPARSLLHLLVLLRFSGSLK